MFGSVDKYKTKKGVKYRLRWDGQSKVFDTFAQLQEYRRDVAAKRKGGSGQTVDWLIDEFLNAKLAAVEAEKLERGTYEDYKFILNRYVRPDALAKEKLNNIDTPAVSVALERVRLKTTTAALKKTRTHIAVMFGWAVSSGCMLINPSREVKLSISSRHDIPDDDLEFDELETERVAIPTPDQVKKILTTANEFDPKGRAAAQITMLFWGGLRPSEMLGFPVRAQKLGPDGRLRCKVIQRANKNAPEIGRLKSASSKRQVTLGKDATLVVRKYVLAGPKDGLLFPTQAGTPWLYSNFRQRVWVPILKEALGEGHGFTPHQGRHFAISALIAAGAQPKRIQGFAGHATLKVTMDVYGHLFPDIETDNDLADAIDGQVKRA